MTYDIYNMPPRLFKYYSFDRKLNSKRINGDVYLACPFDFNDPCDCQREVINNTNARVAEKGDDWLISKLLELEYSREEAKSIADSLKSGDSDLKKVHKRMLERVGILCMSSAHADTLMWGYYANNEGFCVEYDTAKIIKAIVLGSINEMSYTTTRFLFDNENYKQNPEERTPDLPKKAFVKASEFKSIDLKKLYNKYLGEQTNTRDVLYFVQNVFLKRFYGRSIKYNVEPNGSPSPLFFDRNDKSSELKYFIKTKTWTHEQEFRLIFSLGGRKVIKLGKECIKNIYVGCNMSNENIVSLAYLMANKNLSAGLFKMQKLKNCGLAPISIDWSKYKDDYVDLESELNNKFPEL